MLMSLSELYKLSQDRKNLIWKAAERIPHSVF
jgi:hypothetical protein